MSLIKNSNEIIIESINEVKTNAKRSHSDFKGKANLKTGTIAVKQKNQHIINNNILFIIQSFLVSKSLKRIFA